MDKCTSHSFSLGRSLVSSQWITDTQNHIYLSTDNPMFIYEVTLYAAKFGSGVL